MLKEVSDADNVITVSISGRLDKVDIEQIVKQLDAAFARGGKVHVFAEVLDFEGMSADAWISDITHGLRYFTRLSQFGRIAIVSDQSWIRAASRIESALLPFVSYEVFTPDKRDHALAWVKGEIDTPHPGTLRIVNDGGIVTLEANGRITRESADALRAYLAEAVRAEAVRTSAPLRILANVRAYDGFDPAILLDPKYLELKLSLLRHVSRYAVVGGPVWMERIVELSAPLLRMKLRHFGADEEQAARSWLAADGDDGGTPA